MDVDVVKLLEDMAKKKMISWSEFLLMLRMPPTTMKKLFSKLLRQNLMIKDSA